MVATWVDRLETRIDEQDERTALLRRVAELERRLADLEEWLAEVGDDMIDRTERVA